MPTYQYSCNDCGHFFEIVQAFSDDSLSVCPECEGRLRKVFNAVGVVFKGSGFYRNDSRSQKAGAESGAESSSAKNGSSGSDTKSGSGSDSGSGSSSGGGGKSAEPSSGSSSTSAPTPA
ncbi:MAG TPA: FmdB family zinc ribbon protein [Nocardioides sp.]|nr:FmdB family zinc ribbon protein [Nocardioides sp.]